MEFLKALFDKGVLTWEGVPGGGAGREVRDRGRGERRVCTQERP